MPRSEPKQDDGPPLPSKAVIRGHMYYIGADGAIDVAKRAQFLSEKAEYDHALKLWIIGNAES